MKKELFLLLLSYSTTLCGQGHNFDTSLLINKQVFKIQTKEIHPGSVALTIYQNTKIISVDTVEAALATHDFPDFDKDGNKDIMLRFVGHNDVFNPCLLYLFDRTTNAFRSVKGFSRFPAPQQLKTNLKYYVSYYRTGCNDLDWVSDLFLIDNFKTVHVGQMYGKGCDFDPKARPRVIEVYKIFDNTENKKKLITKLSYQKNVPDLNYKWKFISNYWQKNYVAVSGASPGK